ncbi:MAG: hypothetical protein ACFNJQ_03195, partial [Scardovia wiggsiae]
LIEGECLELFHQDKGFLFTKSDILHSSLRILAISSPSIEALKKILPHFKRQTGIQVQIDTVSSAEVLGFLRKSVTDLGQTIVMVTHDAVAASYADRAIVFADGQIVADVADPNAEMMNALLVREQEKAAAARLAQ